MPSASENKIKERGKALLAKVAPKLKPAIVKDTRVVARSRRLGAYIEAQLKPPELRTAEECDQRPEVVLREIGANLANISELAMPAPA